MWLRTVNSDQTRLRVVLVALWLANVSLFIYSFAKFGLPNLAVGQS
jgi:hypothetical protein